MYVTVSLIIIIILASAAIYLACLLRRYRLSAQKKEEYVKDLQEISTKNTSLIKKQSEELLAKNLELTRVNDDMVELLGNVVELRDRESGEHVIRVKTYTNILARYVMENFPRYGLSEDEVAAITTASAMHDIGKIRIPDAVLTKPGRLTAEEFAVMKSHSEKGAEILQNAPKSWSKGFVELATDICLNHHEKWDGSGYPNGRAGDDIPISAQMVSIADCFDALTQDRVYRKALDPEVSFNMILNGECGVFSPDMKAALTGCHDSFMEVLKNPGSKAEEKDDSFAANNLKLSGLRILIVDDDELSRDLNNDILTEEGAEVLEAENGVEALKLIEENKAFDAVLMDLVMPEMDGIETTSEIRKLAEEKGNMPVIALTADPREEKARKCLEAGANACMSKPLVVSELDTILKKVKKEKAEGYFERSRGVKATGSDNLTNAKKIAAYTDMIVSLSEAIKSPDPPAFAIVMCNIKDLRKVNERFGHDAGDVCLNNAVKIISSVFSRSPVYRIGGDEFAVILQNDDYANRGRRFEELIRKEKTAEEITGFDVGRTAFAAGMAVYSPQTDYAVSDVVRRAVNEMGQED